MFVGYPNLICYKDGTKIWTWGPKLKTIKLTLISYLTKYYI